MTEIDQDERGGIPLTNKASEVCHIDDANDDSTDIVAIDALVFRSMVSQL